jgi:PAS domain S-box-containing protein
MIPKNLKLHQKIGLPGIIWKNEKIQIFENLSEHPSFIRKKEAKTAGLHTAISLPVIVQNRVIAALVFFKKSKDKFDEKHIEFLQKLSVQIGIDIDRKKTTDELDQFFQYSPELISIVDKNGFFKRINPTFTKLLGYSEEEFLSKRYSEFVHPDDLTNSNEVLKSNWKGAITNALINRYIAKNGEIKYIMWHSSEWLEEEGVIYGFGTDITALQQINIELLKCKNVIDNSQNGIFILNTSDNSLIINPALRRSYGFKPDEKINLDILIAMFFDPILGKQVKNYIRNGLTWSGDIQITSKNRVHKDYFLNLGPVFNEQKELIASYCIYTDISERKVFEEELLQYNHKISGILESINDGFFSLNKDFVVTYWNDKAEMLLKTKRKAILGKKLWETFDKNAAPKSFLYYTDVLNSREQIEFIEYFKPLDTWFEVNVYPSEDGISVFFKDITDFKKSQIEREKLLKTLEKSLNEIYIFNAETLKFNYLNEGAFKNIGYSKDEMVELTPLSIKPEHNLKSFQKLINPLKNKSKEKIVFETVHQRKDGSTYPVEVHLQLIQDWENDVFLAVILDITERRKTEMELRKLNESLNKRAEELAISNAELEQFAYVASHDMQEPLRMVTSFMTQLEKNYKEQLDDKAKLYIHYAVDGATRMRKIILDLLEYSRIGRKDDIIETFNVEELLVEAIKLNKIKIDETNALIHWQNLPNIKGSKAALLQVFQNLIGNALKYQMPEEQPQININVEEKEKYWQFEVKDNGIGIEEKYFDKIFIIFQRLHNREEYSGTGIGLAICKKIVENHGGKIWVTSKKEKGSSFYFTLMK